MITANSPWRLTGTVPFATWSKTILNAGGPADLASYRTWDAAGDLSALALAQLGEESSYGTQYDANPASNKNPLNLRPRGGDGFLAFDDYAKGIVNWRVRLLDAAYAYKDTVSIADLITVYAPPSDSNDTAGYIRNVVQRLTEWQQGGTNPVPTATVTFGKVPKPPMVELIVRKAANTDGVQHGYYQLSQPRQNVGVCEHITDGHGSIEFYSQFFGIDGERADDALVDYVVGRDGRIGHLNDENGTRAGWANGADDGLEGDGPAFLAHYAGELDPGNTHLISIEHEGVAAEDWSGAQWNASVALDAWLFDQMHVQHDSFPVNQNVGIVTHLLHSEFTGKGGNALDECPGRYLKQNITRFQNDVKAILMAHQVTGTVTPVADIPTVPWSESAIGHQTLNGVPAIAFLAELTAKSSKSNRVAVYANGACKKGDEIGYVEVGKTAKGRGSYRNEKGQVIYCVDMGAAGVGRSRRSGWVENLPTP